MPTEAKNEPWERLPGETERAFQAAQIYFNLGVNRSLTEVSRQITRQKARRRPKKDRPGPARPKTPHDEGPSSSVKGWAKQFRWAERAAAFDDHMARTRVKAATKAVETEEQEKSRLRRENDTLTLGLSDQLLLKVNEMLTWPLAETSDEHASTAWDPTQKAHVTTVIKRTVTPAKWTFRTAAEMLKVARDLKNDVLGKPAPPEAQPFVARDPAADQDALARVLANRARLREELLRSPTGPPAPGTNPAPERNGDAR